MTQQAHVRSLTPQAVTSSAYIETLVRNMVARALAQPIPRVTAQVRDCYYVFDARTIARFYAANKYVCFNHGSEDYILDESLSALEARLQSHGFFKVRRGELVNMNMVHCLRKQPNVTLELHDGQTVEVSRRLASRVQQMLNVGVPSLRSAAGPAQLHSVAAPHRRLAAKTTKG